MIAVVVLIMVLGGSAWAEEAPLYDKRGQKVGTITSIPDLRVPLPRPRPDTKKEQGR